jgi:two-component system, LytTR family, sensor kinase
LVLFWIIFAAVCYGMLLVDIADALPFSLTGKGFLVPVTRYYLGLSLTGFLTWQITREQRKRVTDKEIYEADIAFIKAQINPHFLFNTLGLFFNQTERPMPKVAQGIEALSNLMRYSIQKANADGYVYLYEEKKFIKELLSIYQLRFNNKLCFDLAISGNISGKRVTPHVIHAIVENAFDMGEFINPMHPIRVKMDISADTLHFSLTYKINSGYRGAGYHVEPLYIRRRLNQAYPGKNTYTVKEENGFHTSQLIIPL